MNTVDEFLEQYPEDLPGRLEFIETKLGIKRKWFKLITEVDGNDYSPVLDMDYEQFAESYEDAVWIWETAVMQCLEGMQYDIEKFNLLSEQQKIDYLLFQVAEWIRLKLYERWHKTFLGELS